MKAISSLPLLLPQTIWKPMPVLTTLSTLPVLAATIWTALIAMTVGAPVPTDFFAVTGAGIGGIIALIEARSKGRLWMETASVFLISFCVGAFGPAIAYALARHWTIVSDALDSRITWHWWTLAGVMFSMKGMLITRVSTKMARRFFETRRCDKCRKYSRP